MVRTGNVDLLLPPGLAASAWVLAQLGEASEALGLGKLDLRTGNREQAAHLTIATTMYREMDMPFWLEQAEAELRQP